MQHLLAKPGSAITASLEGFALCYPDLLRVHFDPDYVTRAISPSQPKVALISGSGSGHEPLPTGYVGAGMLDAACPGPIFTSASPNQLLAAARDVGRQPGVLFIVKNYSGGVLNSSLAMEMAEEEGILAQSILVNDDVAIKNPLNRRGLGATILSMKIAGAAAEAGLSLEKVAAVGQRTVENARSMGIGMDVHTLSRAIHSGELPDDTIELGVGIHGEPGTNYRVSHGIEEIVDALMEPIVADLPFQAGDQVLALVSGLGGTPLLELFLFFRHIHGYLKKRGVVVQRQLVGNYLTSLGRGGCTVTLLRLDPELTALWDATVHTPALRW